MPKLQVAQAAQFLSYALGSILRPTLDRVERDDAHGIAVLALQQGRRFQVCAFVIRLSKRPTQPAKIILDKLPRLIDPIGHG
jgi:hypothetical protein